MTKKEEKYSIIEICPIRNVVARFGNKWALLIIFILNENKAKFISLYALFHIIYDLDKRTM